MTNPISPEQREKAQVSIDFLKRDMWSKYTDDEEIRTLVIGNVNHIDSYITKLLSSEQAWKERAERAQKEWGYTLEDGETLKQQLESIQSRSARLIKKWKLRARLADKQEIRASRAKAQLNQAIEVLKWYADERNHGTVMDEIIPYEDDDGHRARTFLSSLSQGTEEGT
jgi:DNA repair exonuclease SbcCD ATPase subunit